MTVGTCKLCLNEKELMKSHLIGKEFYALQRDGDDKPVVMTREFVLSTDHQFWAHLLCLDCEALFSTHGEDYTMTMIQRKSQADFRLLNFIHLSRAMEFPRPVPGIPYVAYPGRELGIDTDALAYFALSVVWRCAAHNWPTLKGQTTSLVLGEYYEPIRLYLLGRAPFPARLHVAVTAASDPISRLCFILPSTTRGLPWDQVAFLARGIWFDVYMGERLPMELIERCCVTTPKRVVYLANCEPRTINAAGAMIANARVHENVLSGARSSERGTSG